MGIIFVGSLFPFMVYEVIRKKYKEYSLSKEFCIVFIWFSFMVFIFMSSTGVLNSGYHFIDDHEIYEIRKDFPQFGFWGTMIKWLKGDLNQRFRFTYFLIRVSQCYLLGDNFKLWHIVQSMVSVLSIFSSYFVARKMQTPPWLSYIFSMLVFLGGGQGAVLWRLGPQENFGVLLLMLTLISLIYYSENEKMLIPSIVLTILLGGIKEAFLLLLPLLPFWLLTIKLKKEKVKSLKRCWEIIKNQYKYWVFTYIIFIIDMCIIIFWVGTNKIGYAGIDHQFGVKEYFKAILRICCGSFRLYTVMNILGIILLLFYLIFLIKKNINMLKPFLAYILIPILTYGYILTSQFILHAKSGMGERYLIPATIGFAFFWIIDITYIIKKINLPVRYYYFFIAVLSIILILGLKDEKNAREYAQDGKYTTEMLGEVARNQEANPDIIVSLGYERDLSASVYLQEKYGIKSLFNVNYSHSDDNKVHDGWITDLAEKESIDFNKAGMYLGYHGEIENLMENNGVNLENFLQYKYGNYVLYINKFMDNI